MLIRLPVFIAIFIILIGFAACKRTIYTPAPVSSAEMAVVQGDADRLDLEIQNDRTILDTPTSDGRTILMRAVDSRASDLVRVILKYESNPLKKSYSARVGDIASPLESALLNEDIDIFEMLVIKNNDRIDPETIAGLKKYSQYYSKQSWERIQALLEE